jgi:membrane-associated phospholipid phosphatase
MNIISTSPNNVWRSITFFAVAVLIFCYSQQPQTAPYPVFLEINHALSIVPNWIWSNITLLGDTVILLCLISPLLVFWQQVIASLLWSVPLGAVITYVLKHAVSSPRPVSVIDLSEINQIGPILHNFSFPSGHTMTAFTFLCAIVVLGSRLNLVFAKRILIFSTILLSCLIGLSRIAVGAHWPGDVVAGACVGWIAGLNGVWLSDKFKSSWSSTRAKLIMGAILSILAIWLLINREDYFDGNKIIYLVSSLVTLTIVYVFYEKFKATLQRI